MGSCPSELERERFLTGGASEETVVTLEVHREGCPHCRAWFERARADDELLSPLREVWLETSAEGGPPPGSGPPEIDAQALERYEIGRLIGSGGMGAVYEAEQRSPRRKVALKVVRPGFSSDQLLRRFEFEAEVLGRLDHPGIAKIHEAGTFGAGDDRRPFFAMELVRGLPLKRFVEERDLALEERLRIFVRICQAVEHAHQKGVIHRDLKPANILVSEAGDPKILDFGVARVTDADLQQATLHTNVGQIVGTLAYMSPEQVGGDAAAVDVRSDVYSLGVIFHELLAGERPYEVGGRPITAAVRVIREQAPRPLGAVRSGLRGDLQTIAAKALEKDPARRYGSAGELAADVARYLAREPIAARPPSAVYQLVRFSQRHRALVGGVLAVLLSLVAGLVVSLHLKEEARRERNNVLRLSAFHELQDLQERADTLWPIHPDGAGAMEAWLLDARAFVAGLHPAGDDPGHYAQREAIRARALSPVDGERQGEVETRRERLFELREEIAARRQAKAVRAGAAPPTYEVVSEDRSMDLGQLLNDAKDRTRPDREDFGREARGLALARLAAERAESPGSRAAAGDTLAWALYAIGLDEEALAAGRAALEAVPADQREEFEARLEELRHAVAYGQSHYHSEWILSLERQAAKLEASIDTPSAFLFDDAEDRWWHEQIDELIVAIEDFADEEVGLIDGISPRFGWGVERRLAWARTIEERTVSGPDVAEAWRAAIESIADEEECPAYAGLRIRPQVGLVPVGRDPDSGLWEFAHLPSGALPERDARGRCVIDIDTAIVLVLIPGGDFLMGAQSSDESAPGYHPEAVEAESPVHEVTLSPFFISKCEMTQGQWLRLAGGYPSSTNPDRFDPPRLALLRHPVWNVDWFECDTTLTRFGLQLPTEAQWEYSARAGTPWPWWSGPDKRALVDVANLADASCRRESGSVSWVYEEWDDGHYADAPVGTLRPNPFGLHDVHGNLWERCRDGAEVRFYLEGPRVDPFFPPTSGRSGVARGGSWNDPADAARASIRNLGRKDFRGRTMGLRPGRGLAE